MAGIDEIDIFGYSVGGEVLKRIAALGEEAREAFNRLVEAGFPISTAEKIVTGELPMDSASKAARMKEQGYTSPAFTGSTFDIREFKTSGANPESDFGRGTYATTSPLDATANYAGVGPDLTQRIELRAERLADFADDEYSLAEMLDEVGLTLDDYYADEAGALEKVARAQLLGDAPGGVTYPLRINTQNYAVIGGDNPTVLTDTRDYLEEAKQALGAAADEDDIFDYAEDLRFNDDEGLYARIREALSETDIYQDEQAINSVLEEIAGDIAEGNVRIADIDAAIRRNVSEAYDEATGDLLSSGEISRQTIQNLGFEGVIDNTADLKFGTNRRGFGGAKIPGMTGVTPDTAHIITFPGQEKNIRSQFAAFDPDQTRNPNILAGLGAGAIGLGALAAPQDALAAEQGDVPAHMLRLDGTIKSKRGFLGPIRNNVSGKIMTEVSIGRPGSEEGFYPLLVPTLTQEEIDYIANRDLEREEGERAPIPMSILQKARAHAMDRMNRGLSPFYQDGEEGDPQALNDIDIFERFPPLSPEAQELLRRRTEGMVMTPAGPVRGDAGPTLPQVANFLGLVTGAGGVADIFGQYPEMPAEDVGMMEMVTGPTNPSLLENLREGEYLEAGLQALGAAPLVGAAKGAARGGIRDLVVKGEFDPRFDPRKKEQDRLANLEAEIIPSNETAPMPPLALSELEGEDFVTSMADRTRAGGAVKSINRVELLDPIFLPGGQDFMFNNPNQVWASAEVPSRQILELAQNLKSASGRDPLLIPWRMAPTGGDFSTTTGELMLGFASANMTKRTKAALDKAIRDYRTVGTLNKKGKRVGAGLGFGKQWFGVDDPRAVEAWRNAPDTLRKELMNMMDVRFRDKGGLSIGAARLINADPKQLTARDAGIQNVGRIFADLDIFESTHPSYPFVVPGAGVGVLEKADAATVFDFLPEARFGEAQRRVKDPANPTQREIRALQMKPYAGKITEDILRRIEDRGVNVNSIVGLSGGALVFTLLSAGLLTPEEVQAGGLQEFADSVKGPQKSNDREGATLLDEIDIFED